MPPPSSAPGSTSGWWCHCQLLVPKRMILNAQPKTVPLWTLTLALTPKGSWAPGCQVLII